MSRLPACRARCLAALVLTLALAAPAGAQTLELIGTVEVPTIPRPGADDPDAPQPEIGIPSIVGGSDVWPTWRPTDRSTPSWGTSAA